MLPVNKGKCAYEPAQLFLPLIAQDRRQPVAASRLNWRYALFRLRGFLATRRLGALNAVRMIQV